jgi:hypothetical protein
MFQSQILNDVAVVCNKLINRTFIRLSIIGIWLQLLVQMVPFFSEIIIVMRWTIWKARNALISTKFSLQFKVPRKTTSKSSGYFFCVPRKKFFPSIELWLNSLV